MFFYKNFLYIVLLGLVLAILFAYLPNIDRYLADFFWNTNNHFYLKDNFLLSVVFHTWLKYVLILSMVTLICLTYIKTKRIKQSSKLAIYALLPTLLGITITCLCISLWKHFSAHACPWDLVQYGGKLKGIPWFSLVHVQAGACFPAGHSATGFAYLFLYFLPNLSSHQRKIYLYIGIFLGLLLGFFQQMRGAHFLSHTLASLWWALLVWSIIGVFLQLKIDNLK